MFDVENEVNIALSTGDVLHIQKNEWFRYENSTDETTRLLLLHARR